MRLPARLHFFLASVSNSSYSLLAKVYNSTSAKPPGRRRILIYRLKQGLEPGETVVVMNTLSIDTLTLQQLWDRFIPLPARLRILPDGVLRIQLIHRPVALDIFHPEFSEDEHVLELGYRLHLLRSDSESGIRERVFGWVSARVQSHLPALLLLAQKLGFHIPSGFDIDDSRIRIRLAALPGAASWIANIQIHRIRIADHAIMVTFQLSESFYENFTNQHSQRNVAGSAAAV